jgi:hypothetical protein
LGGVLNTDYNDAVATLSKKNWGKLPHQLNAKQARQLVDKVSDITMATNLGENADYISRISRYNKQVVRDIAKAERNAARASRVARAADTASDAARAAKTADTASDATSVAKRLAGAAKRGGRATAKVIGKAAKVVAPGIVVYVLVTDGPVAAAKTGFMMTPAGDVVTISQAGMAMHAVSKETLSAYADLMTATRASYASNIKRSEQVMDYIEERNETLTPSSWRTGRGAGR